MNRCHLLLLPLALAACSDDPDPSADTAADAADVSQDLDAADASDRADASDAAPTCVAEVPALDTWRLQRDGALLRDALGREVWLRGVNTGGRSKFPPFMPFAFAESGLELHADAPTFDDALAGYADQAASWGVNVVRMPFSWEGLEPERGTFDTAYLARYTAMIDAFAERDVRVIVDFHQDVFARPYCGDGFPLWAMPDNDGTLEIPPFEECEDWFFGYLGSRTPPQLAFDRFWADEDDLQGAFEQMWTYMAGETWDRAGVIGYEIINEPHPGTDAHQPWGREVLTPFYSRVGAVITDAAPGALVFFDGTGTDTTDGTPTPDLPEGETMVYAPHYYHPLVFAGGLREGIEVDVEPGIGAFAEAAADWGVPALMGEFGSKTGNSLAADYLRSNYDAYDRFAMHATAWEFSRAPEDWNNEGFGLVDIELNETPSVDALVRAYPRAVSGNITSFTFDADDGSAELRFAAEPGVTELAAPARLYPEPPQVTLEGVDGCVGYDAHRERVVVRTTGAGEAVVRVTR